MLSCCKEIHTLLKFILTWLSLVWQVDVCCFLQLSNFPLMFPIYYLDLIPKRVMWNFAMFCQIRLFYFHLGYSFLKVLKSFSIYVVSPLCSLSYLYEMLQFLSRLFSLVKRLGRVVLLNTSLIMPMNHLNLFSSSSYISYVCCSYIVGVSFIK